MTPPVLDIPQKDHVHFYGGNEIYINNTHVKNRVIYEIHPENKVFNSTRINFSLITPLIEKFVDDLSINIEAFQKFRLEDIISGFAQSASKLLLFLPDHIGVEVTSSQTVYLFARRKDVKIHLEIFFEHSFVDELPFECVLNVFQNRKQLLNANGSLAKVYGEIQSILPDLSQNYLHYIPDSETYELSR